MGNQRFIVGDKDYGYEEYRKFLQDLFPNNPEVVSGLMSKIERIIQNKEKS